MSECKAWYKYKVKARWEGEKGEILLVLKIKIILYRNIGKKMYVLKFDGRHGRDIQC